VDLRTYSEEHIGRIWTEADHARLADHMSKVDRLVQDVYHLAREAQCFPVSVRPAGARQALAAGDHVVCRNNCGCERIIDHFGISTLNNELIAYFSGGGHWPVDDLRLA